MEMTFWHLAHWALWNNWDILDRPMAMYRNFLQSSLERAQVQQGYHSGARWSKMTDPSGRSAPGEINELLIWQQPPRTHRVAWVVAKNVSSRLRDSKSHGEEGLRDLEHQ